jgi:hypothetical protein
MNNVETNTQQAERHTPDISFLVMMGASLERGGSFQTSGSTASTPLSLSHDNQAYNDWANGPSHIMLIQRICIAFKGLDHPKSVEIPINDKAAQLVLS